MVAMGGLAAGWGSARRRHVPNLAAYRHHASRWVRGAGAWPRTPRATTRWGRSVVSAVTLQRQAAPTGLARVAAAFAPLRDKLRRRLATKPTAIQTTAGAARLGLRSPHPHWIVGRGLCMFRREDFSNVPRNRRRAALELRLPVWSPFRNTGHHCVWAGGVAMVWFWDRDKVAVDPALLGGPAVRVAPTASDATPASGGMDSDAAGVRIVPETVFHPTKPDGLHIQACHEGFELQRWRDGILDDAFWLASEPRPLDIAWFRGRAEDAGAEADAASTVALPQADAAPLLSDPWSSALSPREWLEVNEAPLVAAALLMLAATLVWQETRVWKSHYIKEATVAEFERMQEALAPELTARTELLDLRRQNSALAAILDQPSQARLMALVDQAIPSDAARFSAWRYQQGELRVVVEDPAPDPIGYVEAFSAVPLFRDVQAAPERSADLLEITVRVTP